LLVLRNGKLARWRSSLRPVLEDVGPVAPLGEDYRSGATFGARVVIGREQANGTVDSLTGRWRATIAGDALLVAQPGVPDSTFPVARHGQWTYIAWSPPTPDAPDGRLWLSDQAGVRAVVP
jgi:hypothetical protein